MATEVPTTGRQSVSEPNQQYLPGTPSYALDRLRETNPQAFARTMTAADEAARSKRPPGANIRNVKLLISEADRAAFAFINPWTVESRESRWHGYKTVRPCKTLEDAVSFYEFLGEAPLNRIRAT